MWLLLYVPFAPQAVKPAAAAGVVVVVVVAAADVVGGSYEDIHQVRFAEVEDTNTFAALGEVACELAEAGTKGIANEAAGGEGMNGGVKGVGSAEGGGHDENAVGKFAVSVDVALVGKELAAAGAVGEGEVGNTDSSADQATGLEVVVLEEVLVAGVNLVDPIDRHGSMGTDENFHSLKAVLEVEWQ